MAAVVENRKCSCGMMYRTKLKHGKDTKLCPNCQKDNSPSR